MNIFEDRMKRLSPQQTVRAHCIECLGLAQFNRASIQNCKGDTCFTGPCPFFLYRLGRRVSVKVFRSFCIHCMGGNRNLIQDCPSISCNVYPYRFGKNPMRQGIGGNVLNFDCESKKIHQGSLIDDIGDMKANDA
jgi:hypothetical protein